MKNTLYAEFFRSYNLARVNFWPSIGEAIFIVILFFLLLNFRLENSNIENLIFGYVTWFFCVMLLGDICSQISMDILSGTYERLHFSTVPVYLIYISRILISILKNILLSIFLMAILFSFRLYYPTFSELMKMLLSIGIVVPSIIGIGLILGGVTSRYKNCEFLVGIANNALLFLSGSFLDLNSSPKIVVNISFVLPTTSAYKVFIALKNGDSCLEIIFINLVLSITIFVIGIFVFKYFNNQLIRKNLIGTAV